MVDSLLPMIVASFASALAGALIGGAIIVVSLKTDMGWVKDQIQVLHNRVGNVNQKLDDTREQLFRNLP